MRAAGGGKRLRCPPTPRATQPPSLAKGRYYLEGGAERPGLLVVPRPESEEAEASLGKGSLSFKCTHSCAPFGSVNFKAPIYRGRHVTMGTQAATVHHSVCAVGHESYGSAQWGSISIRFMAPIVSTQRRVARTIWNAIRAAGACKHPELHELHVTQVSDPTQKKGLR